MSNSLQGDQSLHTVFRYDGSQQLYCRWTEDEDRLLKEAMVKFGTRKWADVSKQVPGRTATQCSTRWLRALNSNIHKGKWSKKENQALSDAVNFYKKILGQNSSQLPWNLVSENVPFRSGIQCQARWTETLDPNIRKGRWSAEEDRLLHEGKKQYGCCWVRVASMIPTRTQRQCRTRWKQIHSQQSKSIQKPQVQPHVNFEFNFKNEANQESYRQNYPTSSTKKLSEKIPPILKPINTYFSLELDDILNPQQPLLSPPEYSFSSYSFDESLLSPDMFITTPPPYGNQDHYVYKKTSLNEISHDYNQPSLTSKRDWCI